jgi:uncharacterized membrane protein YukC
MKRDLLMLSRYHHTDFEGKITVEFELDGLVEFIEHQIDRSKKLDKAYHEISEGRD